MPNLRVSEFAATVVAAFRFLRGRPEDVPSKLALVGVVACAAVGSPPAGWVDILTARAWLWAVAGTFLGGLLSIWAGLWVEGDVPRRATAAGQVILRGALLLLLVAVNLSDTYDNPAFVFNLVLGAMD
jgi:hypothetical protein